MHHDQRSFCHSDDSLSKRLNEAFLPLIPPRLCHRMLLYAEWKASPQCSPATSQRRYRLRWAKGRLLLSRCQRPINAAIKANFTGRNTVLKIVKKGTLWGSDFMTLSGSRIKNWHKNSSCIPNPLRHNIVQNSMNLSNSSTSWTGITPPSES